MSYLGQNYLDFYLLNEPQYRYVKHSYYLNYLIIFAWDLVWSSKVINFEKKILQFPSFLMKPSKRGKRKLYQPLLFKINTVPKYSIFPTHKPKEGNASRFTL